jgi:hypothetical protein
MHPMSLRCKGTITDGLIIKNFTILILYENGGHGAISELKDARKQISIFLKN